MENPERDWDAVNDDERDNPPGREPEDSLTDAQAQAMRVAELGTVIPGPEPWRTVRSQTAQRQ